MIALPPATPLIIAGIELAMTPEAKEVPIKLLAISEFVSEYFSTFKIHSFLVSLGINLSSQSSHMSFEIVVPPVQMYPSSIVHIILHPSFENKLSSSHSSPSTLSPSPQTETHWDLDSFGVKPFIQNSQVSLDVIDPPDQTYLFSISQLVLQPSPSSVFSSSQSSEECLSPSPHIISHDDLSVFGDFPSTQSSQVSNVVVDPPLQTCISSI